VRTKLSSCRAFCIHWRTSLLSQTQRIFDLKSAPRSRGGKGEGRSQSQAYESCKAEACDGRHALAFDGRKSEFRWFCDQNHRRRKSNRSYSTNFQCGVPMARVRESLKNPSHCTQDIIRNHCPQCSATQRTARKRRLPRRIFFDVATGLLSVARAASIPSIKAAR
jgi:hypothetical protein